MPAQLSVLSDLMRDKFLALNRSVDDLLTDPDRAKKFALEVMDRLPKGDSIVVTDVLRDLIRQRKLGQQKGGLPRETRDYRGLGSNRVSFLIVTPALH